MYPKIPLAQSLIQICKAHGLLHIVISPGSRNAPLTLGFTQDPDFTCYSVTDERCAAFFALGLIQQLKQPVAVVCTSGSAVLNYYPAVAEAFYSQLPLVVVSADRPKSKIDIGDGQTIRQENVMALHTVFNANLSDNASEENELLINRALIEAVNHQGPVHINAPFEEPLYDLVPDYSVQPKILEIEPPIESHIDKNKYSTNWNQSPKKLVLIGTLAPGILSEETIAFLANDPSTVVMTEVTSNLQHPNFVGSIDKLITPFSDADFKEFQPEILITLGGMVVSKRIKAMLRQYRPNQHWHIDTLRAYDTYGILTDWIRMQPDEFFKIVNNGVSNQDSNYRPQISKILENRAEKHRLFLLNAPYSDLKVYSRILDELPENQLIHISNSAGIRYCQLFDFKKGSEIWCNRGTSGIDGSTSTAVGASVASGKPTILITGDISFFYDSNGLWNRQLGQNFKIILVNNGGGGIFRILPGHQENQSFNTYFETSHNLTAEHLAKMYDFGYRSVNSEEELDQNLKSFYQSEKREILEIFTPEKQNDLVLKAYFKSLS